MGQQLTPQSCHSLLPTVWALLTQYLSNLKMQGDQATVQMKVLASLFNQQATSGRLLLLRRYY